MKRTFLFLVVFVLISGRAFADYFDGNDLKKLMDSDRPQDIGMFRGYVAGVQDINNAEMFCVHENVKLSQSAAIVQKHFADNPQLWHLSAKELVVRALQKSFPCKK
ncbi:MAG: Rap1a/Tai family immunity protein [Parcubacteria group bacterium]